MTVILGPDMGAGQNPGGGQPTNQNSLQPLMNDLRLASPNLGWVAGHLLNEELGGDPTDNNLTPQTHNANHAQSTFEQHIKRMLYCCHQLDESVDRQDPLYPHWYGVSYTVTVSTVPYRAPPIPRNDMHRYAYSHNTLQYKFVQLPKFPAGYNPSILPGIRGIPNPPDNSVGVLLGDQFIQNLRNVQLPQFNQSDNIENWQQAANGIEFSVEIHNEE